MTIAGVGSAGTAAADTTDSITPTATTITAGQTLTVNFTYSSADANLGGWIGLYAAGNTPGVEGSSSWEYVNGDSQSLPTTGTPVTSGSVTLSTAGLAPGTYTLYEFDTDEYSIVGNQVTITIAAPPTPTAPELTATDGTDAATVTQGNTLTLDYGIPASQASATANAVELFPHGANPARPNPLGALQTLTKVAAGTTGTATFDTTLLQTGRYDAYFLTTSGKLLQTSPVVVTVTGPTPTPTATPGTLTAANGTDSTAIKSGDPLSFSYTIPSSEAASSNAVEVFPHGANPAVAKPLFSFSKAAAGTSGAVTFDSTGLEPGMYDVYLTTSSRALFQTDPVVVTVTGDAPQLPSPGQLAGQPNLIVNGGAEIGTGSLDGIAVSTVPGWTTTGLMDEVQYDASDGQGVGGWPTFSTPGAVDRGQNFFGGGGGGVSTATQYINLARAASQIDQGNVRFNLGGWIGGTGSLAEDATVTATFLNPLGQAISTATLDPVTAAQRNDITEFLPENATGTLPRGTTRVKVVITVNGDHLANRNSAGQGYVDNLSFTISSNAVQAPPPPTPPVAHVPRFDHVFVVMMENQDYADIIGNPAAPYLNSLLPKAANLTQSYATAHPSDENYTALASGSTYTQEGNTQSAELPDQQIGDFVGNAGGTWRVYMESSNGPCDRGSQDTYTADDTPFINFKDLSDNQASCQEHEQPLTQLATDFKQISTTPTYAWLSANDCDDMEGCGITAGDNWLSQTLPTIFNSPAWTQQRSLLIITWDEDAADGQTDLQNIPTLILGSQGTVKQGFSTSHRYTAYSLLRTMEAALNLPSMTDNDAFADPVNDIWTDSQGSDHQAASVRGRQ